MAAWRLATDRFTVEAGVLVWLSEKRLRGA